MASLNPQAAARIQEVLQGHIDRGLIPGAVAIISLGGETCFSEALGRRDPAAGDAMRSDSIFRIYSMTKPIVSVAAMMLVEQGRLQLTDAVSHYLPMFAHQEVAVEQDGKVVLVPVLREATCTICCATRPASPMNSWATARCSASTRRRHWARANAATSNSAPLWPRSRWRSSREAVGNTAGRLMCWARCWK